MREMRSWNPTHRSQAAIDAAVATATAAQEMLQELLETHTPEQLEKMGFQYDSYADDPRFSKYFTDLPKDPIEDILRSTPVWDPLAHLRPAEAAEPAAAPSTPTGELLETVIAETPPQPVFGTLEDKVLSEDELPAGVLESAQLGLNGMNQHLRRQLPAPIPPATGVIS